MHVTRTGPDAFLIEFEDENELRQEHDTNLSMGGLHLRTEERLAVYSKLTVILRGPWGAEARLGASIVAPLPDGAALAIDGEAGQLLPALLARPAGTTEKPEAAEDASPDDGAGGEKTQTAWDRIRGLSRMEKILLAAKADRVDRALLVQDNDPAVLFSLLKNPRLTADEVVRLGKSSFLTYQIAELILKTSPWMGNLDVRLAMIHNPKTPPAFAMRILATLPDSDVRAIARGGTSMALKQAALRKLQGTRS